jgi:tetratricopeptide (TPR) repeat protein
LANVFSPAQRHVVPSFRTFADTVALGELSPVSTSVPAQIPIDFDAHIDDWELRPSVGSAGELLSAALVSGKHEVAAVTAAARYILDHPGTSSGPQQSAAERVLSIDSSTTPRLLRLQTFLEENNQQENYRKIHELKSALTRFGDDPIALTELSRLYLIVGNQRQAARSMRMALALAPFNRYVLRSAARLFARENDPEQAFNLLQRNPRTHRDPWLASAELAMAGLIGQGRRVGKSAARILNAGDFSPLSVAELRAGLGSLELMEGDRKQSRRLLQAALEQPNGNALAQVEWALSVDRLFELEVGAFDVSRNYEALALEAYDQQSWGDVLVHCESWFVDMPFSRRPVAMASHVALTVLDDFDAAQMFCKAGLIASPHDPALTNNYAYALACSGKHEEALAVIHTVDKARVTDVRVAVCLEATEGLAHFRAGRVLDGIKHYHEAIEQLRRHPDPVLSQIALLNFAREQALAGVQLPEQIVDSIRSLKIGRREFTIQILKDKVLKVLDKPTARPASPTT